MTTPRKKVAISGHCNIGHHEGTRPKSPSGIAFRTCAALDWCACKCHAEIDKMFESANRERIVITNPDYKGLERSWFVPSLEDKTDELLQVAPHKFEDATPPEFTPTETGRTARGQLEYWVKEAVEIWRANNTEDQCTPKTVADLILTAHKTAPSQGAIHSVFMRWQRIDYAMIGKDPVRFIGLTPAGMKLGLDRLKIRAQLQEGK